MTTTTLDMELARRAYSNISHDPEGAAERDRNAVEAHFAEVLAGFKSHGDEPAQLAILERAWPEYVAGYLNRFHRVLEARSRTASAFICGPSKFPTKRNRKRLDAERRREEEFAAWDASARASIVKALKDARSQELLDRIFWLKLRKIVMTDLLTVEGIDAAEPAFRGFTRQSFVASTARSIRNAHKTGHEAAAIAALELIREKQSGWAKPFFGRNHSVWGLLDRVEPNHEGTDA